MLEHRWNQCKSTGDRKPTKEKKVQGKWSDLLNVGASNVGAFQAKRAASSGNGVAVFALNLHILLVHALNVVQLHCDLIIRIDSAAALQHCPNLIAQSHEAAQNAHTDLHAQE